MILTEFPDIEWLRQKAKSNFADRQGVGGVALPDQGWPSVVLNTRSEGAERKDIAGPFSVFLNLSGQSRVTTERRTLHIGSDVYAISNRGQHYDLIIPQKSPTTTFNVHFGEKLFLDTVHVLTTGTSALLDRPTEECVRNFETYPRTVWKGEEFQRRIGVLQRFYRECDNYPNPVEVEREILSVFLEHLLLEESRHIRTADSLASLKPPTRKELMRRVMIAVDYIHTQYAACITLDELSRTASMSKFHLQRTFKQLMGQSPQQYIANLRLRKSCELMKNSALSLSEIALAAGFSEPAAFSRFFLHHSGVQPSAYRKKLARRVN